MSSQYGELWLTNSWDPFGSLGQPSKFQRVSRLGFNTAPTSLNGGQPNSVWRFAISYIYVFRGSCPLTEFRQVQNSLRTSVAFSGIWSITVLSQLALAKPCGIQQRAPPIFGRASMHWASAHILVCYVFYLYISCFKNHALIQCCDIVCLQDGCLESGQ